MNIMQKIILNPRTCAKCGIKETPMNVIIEYCTINGREFLCDDCLCELDDDYFIDCKILKEEVTECR